MGTRIDWSVSNFSVTIIKSSYDAEKWKKGHLVQFETAYQSSLKMVCSMKETESISHSGEPGPILEFKGSVQHVQKVHLTRTCFSQTHENLKY